MNHAQEMYAARMAEAEADETSSDERKAAGSSEKKLEAKMDFDCDEVQQPQIKALACKPYLVTFCLHPCHVSRRRLNPDFSRP